ncbi:hypothetical protein AUK45_03380 [Candidatus Peregrinibacteria bacterium CG2_30_44_17]|nr:MAG: hypothetical protein AUK45_03380 [Candidatus Peregrinibacteria bacterium CG2_30_44_17]
MKKLIDKTPKHVKQFIKFGMVGMVSLVVNMVAYTLFTRVFAVYYVAADVLAYIVAIINSYALNRTFTFKSTHKKVAVQFTKYLTVYLVGMTLSATLLYIFVHYFAIYDLLAKILIVGIVMIWNFLASKFLIFDRDEGQDQHAENLDGIV